MSPLKPASVAYTEDFVIEPAVAEAARRQGEALGATPVGPAAGALLSLLAAAVHARSVVEIGSGAGVSGLWLLAGMPAEGILTTIDIEPAHTKAAREAFAAGGYPTQRTRCITGDAMTVLPRMTDGAYDMVHVDAEKADYPRYVEQGIRLLRPGGVLVLDNMLWHDKVADPAARDEITTLLRDLSKSLRDDDRLNVMLLPLGDGQLAAVKKDTAR